MTFGNCHIKTFFKINQHCCNRGLSKIKSSSVRQITLHHERFYTSVQYTQMNHSSRDRHYKLEKPYIHREIDLQKGRDLPGTFTQHQGMAGRGLSCTFTKVLSRGQGLGEVGTFPRLCKRQGPTLGVWKGGKMEVVMGVMGVSIPNLLFNSPYPSPSPMKSYQADTLPYPP